MFHEQLDIGHWKHVFSISHLQAVEGMSMITGPRDMAVIEQLREKYFASLPKTKCLPTDVFIWNYGEPEQRAVTKVSGLPYRAAGKPWPRAASGVPLNFVAQFCFADSRDLVPPLPGDLLLVFIEGKESSSGYNFVWGRGNEQDSALIFEWVSLEDIPLATQAEVPETPWQVMPCYGTIYRTWDCPEIDSFAYPDITDYMATILEGTKIGGAYPFPWIDQQTELGTYLCTLSSVSRDDGPYPFLNIPGPIPSDEWRTYHALNIGDMGLLNIFLTADGTIGWMADS